MASVLQTGAAWRSRRAQARAAWPTPVPTVVVGNWVLGGAGKTPITLALVRHLQQRGFRPGIVSRGYGGPTVADSEAPVFIPANAAEPGGADEALLLARRTGVPVAIHPRRHRAREALCARHPEVDVVVADDALQHRALSRDLEVVAVDERGLGNGLTLPAGPLRERPYRAERTLWLYVGAPALAGWPGHQARRRLSPPLPWRAWAADPNGALSPEAGHSATDRKSTRLNSSHIEPSRMPSSA